MSDSYYDTAQICQNGHVINSMASKYPESNQAYCDKCGASTIISCPKCQTPIRGDYHDILISHYSAPAYCHQCGQAFPWTRGALEAAHELADTLEELSDQEREELKKSIEDLLRETPRTRVAETKFKKLMLKAGKEAYDGMKSILTDIVSETVKKTLFGA